MSRNLNQLHSHSALERDLRMPKNMVLIDAEYGEFFKGHILIPFRFNGVDYFKVNILLFVYAGGIFKNLSA